MFGEDPSLQKAIFESLRSHPSRFSRAAPRRDVIPFTREPYRGGGRSDSRSDHTFKSSLRKGTKSAETKATTKTRKPKSFKPDPSGPPGSASEPSSIESVKRGEKSGKEERKMEEKHRKKKPTIEEIKTHFAPSDHPFIDKIARDILDEPYSSSSSSSTAKVTWEDVIGLESAKSVLTETLLIRFYIPDFFHGLRAKTHGILLFGPPGTGKTMIVKAALSESGSDITFFNVSVTTFASKFHGESETLVRILFEMARLMSPSIVFMDEVDALLSTRGSASEHEASRRVKTELLVQLDGLVASPSPSSYSSSSSSSSSTAFSSSSSSSQTHATQSGDVCDDHDHLVLFIAATNHPWSADEALLRRVGTRIYVPLPNADDREKLIRSCMKQHALDECLHRKDGLLPIVSKTEGYSASDVVQVCREASMMTLRRNIAGKSVEELKKLQSKDVDLPITLDDFMAALDMIKPSVSKDMVSKYEEWDSKFGYRN